MRTSKLYSLLFLVAIGLASLAAARAQDLGSGVKPMGSLWNSAAPAISGSLFSTSLKPSVKCSMMRIAVTLKVGGVLYLSESNGTTTQVVALNDGNALTAFHAWGCVYPMRREDESGAPLSYNFQLATATNGGTVFFRCDELLGPAN